MHVDRGKTAAPERRRPSHGPTALGRAPEHIRRTQPQSYRGVHKVGIRCHGDQFAGVPADPGVALHRVEPVIEDLRSREIRKLGPAQGLQDALQHGDVLSHRLDQLRDVPLRRGGGDAAGDAPPDLRMAIWLQGDAVGEAHPAAGGDRFGRRGAARRPSGCPRPHTPWPAPTAACMSFPGHGATSRACERSRGPTRERRGAARPRASSRRRDGHRPHFFQQEPHVCQNRVRPPPAASPPNRGFASVRRTLGVKWAPSSQRPQRGSDRWSPARVSGDGRAGRRAVPEPG